MYLCNHVYCPLLSPQALRAKSSQSTAKSPPLQSAANPVNFPGPAAKSPPLQSAANPVNLPGPGVAPQGHYYTVPHDVV